MNLPDLPNSQNSMNFIRFAFDKAQSEDLNNFLLQCGANNSTNKHFWVKFTPQRIKTYNELGEVINNMLAIEVQELTNTNNPSRLANSRIRWYKCMAEWCHETVKPFVVNLSDLFENIQTVDSKEQTDRLIIARSIRQEYISIVLDVAFDKKMSYESMHIMVKYVNIGNVLYNKPSEQYFGIIDCFDYDKFAVTNNMCYIFRNLQFVVQKKPDSSNQIVLEIIGQQSHNYKLSGNKLKRSEEIVPSKRRKLSPPNPVAGYNVVK